MMESDMFACISAMPHPKISVYIVESIYRYIQSDVGLAITAVIKNHQPATTMTWSCMSFEALVLQQPPLIGLSSKTVAVLIRSAGYPFISLSSCLSQIQIYQTHQRFLKAVKGYFKELGLLWLLSDNPEWCSRIIVCSVQNHGDSLSSTMGSAGDLLQRTTTKTMKVLTTTGETTKAVLTAVSDHRWWKESLNYLRPLQVRCWLSISG